MNNLKNFAKSLMPLAHANGLTSKKSLLLIKPRTGGVVLFWLLCITICSCGKDNGSTIRHPLPASTSLMIVQGVSNDISNGNISLDKSSIGNKPLEYGAHTDYLYPSDGSHLIQIGVHGSGVLTYVGLASDTVLLNPANNYSLFLWPTYTAATNNYPGTRISDQVGFTLLVDSLYQPAQGQAKIRFVNVSLNTGAVDLVMNGKVLVHSKATGDYSLFIPITPTTNNTFEVNASSSSVILSSQKNIDIKSGGIYTIWLYGAVSPSQNNGLNLGIITNKQY